MEIFVNQGRDSTIEPAYLAEKKQAISEPNLTTLNVTPTSEAQTITPESPVDGYSQVNVAAAPSADLITKTYEVPIPDYIDTISAQDDDADGYSNVDFVGPSQEDIAANWIEVTVNVNSGKGTVTLGVTDEQLTAAYQSGKRKFYVAVQQEI